MRCWAINFQSTINMYQLSKGSSLLQNILWFTKITTKLAVHLEQRLAVFNNDFQDIFNFNTIIYRLGWGSNKYQSIIYNLREIKQISINHLQPYRDQTVINQSSIILQGSNKYQSIIYNFTGFKQISINYLQPYTDQTNINQSSTTSQGSNTYQLIIYKFREIN